MTTVNLKLLTLLIAAVEHAHDPDRWLTEAEVAQITGLSIYTLKRYRDDGLIEFIRLEGGNIRYTREGVKRFAEARTRTMKPTRPYKGLKRAA